MNFKTVVRWFSGVMVAFGIFATFSVFSGCGNLTPRQVVEESVDFLPAVAQAVSVIAISSIEDPKERQEVANYMYAIAHGIRSLSGGKVPSVEEIQSTIIVFGGKKSQFASLAKVVSGFYEGYYAKVKGDPKLALQVLESLARGCENAATSILDDVQPQVEVP